MKQGTGSRNRGTAAGQATGRATGRGNCRLLLPPLKGNFGGYETL